MRKKAVEKKIAKKEAEIAKNRGENPAKFNAGRDWAPWVFLPLGLIGVLWLLLFYIAGADIGFIRVLGNWNYLIGLGLIAASFVTMTFWK